MKDFTNCTETVDGTPVKDIRYSEAMKMWKGKILWPESTKDDKFVVMLWGKSGKAVSPVNPGKNLK